MGLGFACVLVSRSGLRTELEVQIHRLSERLLGRWPSMFLLLYFVFAAASVSGPGVSPPWVLCRSWPPPPNAPDRVRVLSVLQQSAEFENRTSCCLCPFFSTACVLRG